jgi:uncharacterized membrane protein YoaK (UPF0700 family)
MPNAIGRPRSPDALELFQRPLSPPPPPLEKILSMHVAAACALLSFAGGFVEAALFIHLSGLFTGSVTGNLISIVSEASTQRLSRSAVTFAFFLSAALCAAFASCMRSRGRKAGVLGIAAAELVLLVALALLGPRFGPQVGGDEERRAILLGSTAAAAMGAQNALTRLAFPPSSPQTTIMTGTIVSLAFVFVEALTVSPSRLAAQELAAATVPLATFLGGAALASLTIKGGGLVVLLIPCGAVALVALDIAAVAAHEWRERRAWARLPPLRPGSPQM